MQYWINYNGVQSGPVDLDGIKEMRLTSAAYVWREGMSDWARITQLPELQGYYEMEVKTAEAVTGQPYQPAQPSQPVGAQPQYAEQEPTEPCPPTNFVWAILATVLCCIPLGVMGIIYALKVTKKYTAGDLKGAQEASETGAWWIIAAIVLGVMWRPLMFMLGTAGA